MKYKTVDDLDALRALRKGEKVEWCKPGFDNWYPQDIDDLKRSIGADVSHKSNYRIVPKDKR
jgi:hypothetical protein